jgi:hypothetical protein
MDSTQRAIVFWSVCLPTRLYFASTIARDYEQLSRLLALLVGGRWITGAEMSVEGFFGGPAWWAESRRVHGALWLAYAALGDRELLYADVLYGALNWLLN